MARKAPPPASAPAAVPAPATPSARSLATLCALGFLSALWTAFLWSELVLWRKGGTPVCGFSEGGECGALWDSALAGRIHDVTGLPVAGWGLAWSLVAFVLPLAALVVRAEARPLSPSLVSAVRWTAGGGALVGLLLASASASARIFCFGCAMTDLLVAAYAAVALYGWRKLGLPDPWRGLALAGLSTAGAVTLLLYPGLHTPMSREAEARRVLPGAASGEDSAARQRDLAKLVSSLSPEEKQLLSDTLEAYRRAPSFPPKPRGLVGPASAPVRITTFSDVLCSHCAELHRTLRRLRESTPAGSFQLELRQFPLDGACNPALRRSSGDPVRCLAARAQICLENRGEEAFAFSGALFEGQESLTVDKVFALAAPYLPRDGLQACMQSRETQARLEEDERETMRHAFQGTPLVLVNGRQGSPLAPFLYAMILSGGDDAHPALAALPPPRVHAASAAM